MEHMQWVALCYDVDVLKASFFTSPDVKAEEMEDCTHDSSPQFTIIRPQNTAPAVGSMLKPERLGSSESPLQPLPIRYSHEFTFMPSRVLTTPSLGGTCKTQENRIRRILMEVMHASRQAKHVRVFMPESSIFEST